jgi:hypothetical protein
VHENRRRSDEEDKESERRNLKQRRSEKIRKPSASWMAVACTGFFSAMSGVIASGFSVIFSFLGASVPTL